MHISYPYIAIPVKISSNRKLKAPFKVLLVLFVSTDGIGPSSKAYESFVLPLNYADNISTIARFLTLFNNRKSTHEIGAFSYLLRGHELHVGLKVMSLPRYYFSTPLWEIEYHRVETNAI